MSNELTLADIRALEPCYDPAKYLPEDWRGSVADILRVNECPPQDRIWVASQFIDDKTARLFAVWCAREALKLVDNPDPRSLNACDVAERYANGDASSEELAEAVSAAVSAARSAAEYAALSAARSAAEYAARSAARYAAEYAALSAAGSAARYAARYAAWYAAWEKQIDQLITMLERSR
jgi:hypothetical protein